MGADALTTQGAKASATMILIMMTGIFRFKHGIG